MATGQANLVVHHIRRLIRGPGDATDAELLERFRSRHEGTAFAALVERHGPMVLGVCRRVLSQEQDAEDAFQATFLVLALRAGAIRKQGSLGSWLYGVASRLALKMKAQAGRRRLLERQAVPMFPEPANGQRDWAELRPVLDEELQHLPQKYRAPLVLCYLEGKTHADAARELGCALGSMSKRLSRGCDLLRVRLVRRGITLSLPLLGTLLAEQTRAAVTPALLEISVQAALRVAAKRAATEVVSATAAALAQGVTRKMFLTKLKVTIGLLIGIALVLGSAGLAAHSWVSGRAEDNPQEPVPQAGHRFELPADLALVPGEAIGFVRVTVQDLYESDLLKAVRRNLGEPLPEHWRDLEKKTGLRLADVQSAVAIFLFPGNEQDLPRGPVQAVVVLTMPRPFAQERIRQALGTEAKEHQVQGKTYVADQAGEAVAFLNDRTVVFSTASNMERFLAARAPAGLQGPLGSALKLAARGHTLVAGFRVPEAWAQEVRKQPLPAPYAFVKPLLDVESGSLVVDLNGDLEGKVRMRFPDEKVTGQAYEAAKTGLYLLRQQLAAGLPPDWQRDPLVTQLVKEAEKVLKTARLSQDGKMLQLAAETKASTLTAFSLPALAKMRTASGRMKDQNNLKQIALAMHMYADVHGSFPPAAIHDKDGKPLLSWRVAILPYLEQDALYKQFKLDESWDGPHNRQLVARMPATYAMPGLTKDRAGETHYQVFTGKGTVFEGDKGIKFSEITDGTSNTLLVVEAAGAVPWTKPADLPYDAAKPLPRLGGMFPEGFSAALGDGSVRFLSKTIDDSLLRALITRNGGELIQIP
jgi:RNA polymerase sigma factor (sigma-70 family)